jgi:hypothetical protein
MGSKHTKRDTSLKVTSEYKVVEVAPLWTEGQVAKFLNKSIRSIQALRYNKTGPAFFKIGKSIRYNASDVRKWLGNKSSSM